MKKFIKSYYSKIFLYIALPFIIIIITFSIINQYYLKKLESEAINKCENSLVNASQNLTDQLYEISNSSSMLESSQDFFDVFFGNNIIPSKDNYKFSRTVTALRRYKYTKNYINSVVIIDKTNKKIISSDGIVSFNYYFKNKYFGENYNTEEFWLNLKTSNNLMKVLPLDRRSETIDIIPLAFFQIGVNNSINPLIVNLDKNKFSNFLFQYKVTTNSNLFVYNSSNNEIIASTNNTLINNKIIKSFLENPDFSKITFNNEKMLLISHTSKDLYNDTLKYFMLIPEKDISSIYSKYRYISTIVLICCYFLGFALCYIFSIKIYKPIKGLASLVSSENLNSKESVNEMELLDNKIKDLILNNLNLTKDLNTIIPSVCEKYILNILQQDDYNSKELEPLLKRYNFSFPHKYFTTIMLSFNFTKDFYDIFSSSEQKLIQEKLLNLIILINQNNYKKYVLRIDKNIFCIILNSEQYDLVSVAENDVAKLQSLFSYDNEYIKVFAGIGRTYKESEGIYSSWKEARYAFMGVSDFSSKKIAVYSDSTQITTGYSFTALDDNHIFNCLLSGNLKELLDLLKKIINRNISESISEHSLKDLYIQIYNIGVKVVNLKNINIKELMGEQFIDIIRYANTLQTNDLADYIINFYTTLCTYNKEINSNIPIDINDLKKYLDENFTKDIYLDALAEKYNVTVKYMSKLLKTALGIPFKQYINNLRILKSKELLTNADNRIEDIAIAVGFNSRNTFIRAFKLIEGVTPSEYRDKHK